MLSLSVQQVDPVADTYDLDGSLVDGLESVRQRIQQRLRFWRGTWFLDSGAGVPYLRDVLGHRRNLALATSAITAQIRTVPDVTVVQNVTSSFDFDLRIIDYSAVVQTTFGDLSLEEQL